MFHLQAIYYRMKGPTVVINGKTLKVGEQVDGAKLVDIERTSAEIEYQGWIVMSDVGESREETAMLRYNHQFLAREMEAVS